MGSFPSAGRMGGVLSPTQPPESMYINLQSMAGDELSQVVMHLHSTLADLQLAVHEVQPPPLNAVWSLVLGNSVLTNDASKTLADSEVQNGSTLVLVKQKVLLVATGSMDGTAKIWRAASGECMRTLTHGSAVSTVVISPDGASVLTASYDCVAKIWNASRGECMQTIPGVSSASFSPDGASLLIVSARPQKKVEIWSTTSRKFTQTLDGHETTVLSAMFSPDGASVLTASFDGTAKIWNVASGECTQMLSGHGTTVWSAMFSPDGSSVLTASSDGTAKIWNAFNGECMQTRRHGYVVSSALFSPDGAFVLTVSCDSTVKIWNTCNDASGGKCSANGDCMQTLSGHTKSVSSAVFSPDGASVLTASWDKTAKLWKAADRKSVV